MASFNIPFKLSRESSRMVCIEQPVVFTTACQNAILRENKPQLPINEGLSNVQVFGHVLLN